MRFQLALLFRSLLHWWWRERPYCFLAGTLAPARHSARSRRRHTHTYATRECARRRVKMWHSCDAKWKFISRIFILARATRMEFIIHIFLVPAALFIAAVPFDEIMLLVKRRFAKRSVLLEGQITYRRCVLLLSRYKFDSVAVVVVFRAIHHASGYSTLLPFCFFSVSLIFLFTFFFLW